MNELVNIQKAVESESRERVTLLKRSQGRFPEEVTFELNSKSSKGRTMY